VAPPAPAALDVVHAPTPTPREPDWRARMLATLKARQYTAQLDDAKAFLELLRGGKDAEAEGVPSPEHWDVNLRLGSGRTPLTRAIELGAAGAELRAELRTGGVLRHVARLLDARADPNLKDAHGEVATHVWASTRNHPDMLALLLDRKASINIPDDRTRATALHTAVRNWSNSDGKMDKEYGLLLDAKADVRSADHYSKTVLSLLAYRRAHARTLARALAMGADPNGGAVAHNRRAWVVRRPSTGSCALTRSTLARTTGWRPPWTCCSGPRPISSCAPLRPSRTRWRPPTRP
jgi:hypothetical protein